ncbi:MAG: 50S ribosomal protein L24 [Thermogutta sp.]
MLIRIDDTVEVISGDDRGVRGRVLRVDRQTGRIVVEGVNVVLKHVRRSRQARQGGRLSKERPIDMSNVMLVCPACKQRTRVGKRLLDDGSKVRYCKKCDANIGQISRAKTRRRTANA